MSFANPAALYWALLAIPIVLSYLRSSRAQQHPVATGFLWQRVLAAERSRRRWRRWRDPVSLGVQLLILGLIVAALADPQRCAPRPLVLLIDNSGSSNGTESEPAGLARAKQTACRLAAAAGDHQRMAVISAGSPLQVRCGLTECRRLVQAAIEAINPGGGPAQVDQATALARRLLADAGGGEIVVLGGDRGAETAAVEAGPAGPPLWWYLAASAVLLLVPQWCLHQRCWLS